MCGMWLRVRHMNLNQASGACAGAGRWWRWRWWRGARRAATAATSTWSVGTGGVRVSTADQAWPPSIVDLHKAVPRRKDRH